MPTRLTIALVLACTLLGAGFAGSLWLARSEAQRADQYERTAEGLAKQLEQAQARTGRIQAQLREAEQKRQLAQMELKEALDADPAWRDAAVPEPVYNGLCEHIRCK